MLIHNQNVPVAPDNFRYKLQVHLTSARNDLWAKLSDHVFIKRNDTSVSICLNWRELGMSCPENATVERRASSPQKVTVHDVDNDKVIIVMENNQYVQSSWFGDFGVYIGDISESRIHSIDVEFVGDGVHKVTYMYDAESSAVLAPKPIRRNLLTGDDA